MCCNVVLLLFDFIHGRQRTAWIETIIKYEKRPRKSEDNEKFKKFDNGS